MSKFETVRMGSTFRENEREYFSITILLRTNNSKKLYSDRLAISKEYRDIAKLKSAEPKLWLKNRNELVLSFLEGATNK